MSRSSTDHICGLYFTTGSDYWTLKRHYLAQAKLESHTTITPVYQITKLKQTFSNPCAETIKKLRYSFPLYDGVSVGAYTIKYGSKTLKGVVKQKEAAKQTYDAAVSRGETAGLLESLPAGVFAVTLGNVPPKTDVLVSIEYSSELKHDAAIDGLRYMLPTSIAPRYGSYPGELLGSNVSESGGINITVDVDMGKSAIRKIQSPSHPISVSMGSLSTESSDGAFQPSKASATLTQGKTELGEDFILELLIDDISKPQAILEKHSNLQSRAIMATLVPKFSLPLTTPEVVFIADQSGSMCGKNQELIAALNIFLKSLPVGVRFNICAFGSTYKFLWDKSQPYNEANLTKATKFVNEFSANYGGTEMYKPIEEAFKRRLRDLSLEVMLLTDGEIWAEEQLFTLINKHIHEQKAEARVFALGIGGDVSHTLVEGVARAGNGFAQFVTENEQVDQKVIRMLKAALYPHTKDYSIEVNYDDRSDDVEDDFELVEKVNDCLRIEDISEPKGRPKAISKVISFFDKSVDLDTPMQDAGMNRYAHLPTIPVPKLLQAPSNIPPLFPFNRTYLYLILGPETPQKNIVSVTLRATAPTGPLELTIPVHRSDAESGVVHQLAARKAVQDLEEGRGWLHAANTPNGRPLKKKYESRFDELVEREAVRLGEQFQVAGKWCSFVAVDDASNTQVDDEKESEGEESLAGGAFLSTSRAAPKKRKVRTSAPRMDAAMSYGAQSFGTKGAAAPMPPPPPPSALHSAAPAAGPLFSSAPPAPGSSESRRRSSNYMSGPTNITLLASGMVTRQARVKPNEDWKEDVDEDGEGEGEDEKREGAHGGGQSAWGTNKLHFIINLQTFGGSWKWTNELLNLIGVKEAAVKNLGQNDLAATALVLAYLEKEWSAQEEVWEMVAAKARTWMSSQVACDEAEKLIKTAKASL